MRLDHLLSREKRFAGSSGSNPKVEHPERDEEEPERPANGREYGAEKLKENADKIVSEKIAGV